MEQHIKKQKQAAVFVIIVFLLISHVGATQWFAHHIHYADEFLGDPVLVDKAINAKVYAPHKIYSWYVTYRGQGVDDLFLQSFGGLGAGVLLGFIAGGVLFRRKRPEKSTAHGSARWATEQEIKDRGFLVEPAKRIKDKAWAKDIQRDGDDPERAASSICFAKTPTGTLYFSWDVTHTIAFAPTRSGKGVGMVIPTLLSWTESVVVTDIKGENFQISAWWRALFSHVVYFNPTDPNSAQINPLLEIRKGAHAIQDAMNIAEILGARPKGKENPFWDGGGRDVLTATILFTLYTQKEKSLSQCIKLLMNSQALFEDMQHCDLKDRAVQDHLNDSATSFLEQDDKVRGGWVASALSYLSLWKDPIVAANTSTSDFRLRDVQYARRPMSIYLVIPPGDIERLSPLVRLFFQQLTDVLTVQLNEKEGEHRHRLLMMMDEFPQFGNMAKVEKALAYTAGYGIKWFLVTQGLPQLDDIYGPHNSFLANCHLRLAYRCNDHENAQRISKTLGDGTGTKKQEGESGKKGLLNMLNQRSISQVEFKRELMTPGELMTMDSCRVLIMEAGQHPIKAHKLTYYNDPFFIPRYKNKQWDFPSKPLTDFPGHEVQHDWGPVQSASRTFAPELVQESMHELLSEKKWEGEEPMSQSILKIESSEMDELDIPEDMTGREASAYLTTRSLRREHIQDMLERGMRAGLVDQTQLNAFLADIQTPSKTSTHTPEQDVSDASTEISESVPAEMLEHASNVLENPDEHEEPGSPLNPPEAQNMFEDLNAFLGLVEEDEPPTQVEGPQPDEDRTELPDSHDLDLLTLPDTDDTLVVADMEDRIRQAMQEGARIKALDDSFSFTHPFDDDVD